MDFVTRDYESRIEELEMELEIAVNHIDNAVVEKAKPILTELALREKI